MSIEELFGLKGSVALVTGAAKWLGWDAACILSEAGASVIVTSRDASKASETAARLHEEYGGETLGLVMDQCRYEDVKACMEEAFRWKGRLDILVNNAGGGSGKSPGHILKRDPKDEESMIRTNLLGPLWCAKEAARWMTEQKRGVIISIASIAGLVGRDRRMYDRSNMKGQPVDYAASKSGIIGMTRDLAAMLAPYGIRVNSISPGGFEKPGDLPEAFMRDYADATMLGRWGRMGTDIKGAVLFLASDASAYVTGHNLVVDGGFSVFK